MLRFHAKPVAELVNPAALAGEGPIQKVAGVELQARFSGEDFQNTAAGRFSDAGQERQFAEPFVEDPVVIVALPELELFIVLVNAGADGGRLAEVERSAFDAAEV